MSNDKRQVKTFFKEFTKTNKRRKPINRISKQKEELDKELETSKRIVKLRSQNRCEMPGTHDPGCNGWGVECHHVMPRSLGGSHDPSNLAWLSRPCHDKAEAHNSEMFYETTEEEE